MPVTPVYGIPYSAVTDPPHGPNQQGALALAVEAELVRVDAAHAAGLDRVALEVVQTTLQTIANNTWVALTFTTEQVDSHSAHSTSTNTSRFTCPTGQDGVFLCNGGVSWATNGTGVRNSRWHKNGTLVNGSGTSYGSIAVGQPTYPARQKLIQLAAGDYLELFALQTSGGSLDTAVTDYIQSSMSIIRVRS